MAKDFHEKPFDQGTCTKLDLIGDYIEEWLPVWLCQAKPSVPITIVDFFAGPGEDSKGRPGSPLIALKKLRQSSGLIEQKNASVRLLLNEGVKKKASFLRQIMSAQRIPAELCSYDVTDFDFAMAFRELYPKFSYGPNLLILDQQGMKAISDDIFRQILKLSKTDFLFFIASSSVRRFEAHPYFQKHLKIPTGSVSSATFNNTHRAVTAYYQELANSIDQEYLLGTFSIKKASNVYGLIFGTRHLLGLEKFLKVCWKADPERGEANFDIDDDRIDRNAPYLFSEMDQTKKLSVFRGSIKNKILTEQLRTDAEVYIETLREGFLPSEGKAVIRELVRLGGVRVVGGQPRVSRAGYSDPRQIEVLLTE